MKHAKKTSMNLFILVFISANNHFGPLLNPFAKSKDAKTEEEYKKLHEIKYDDDTKCDK